MDPVTIKAITPVILKPVISSIIHGAKNLGIYGFKKWEESRFHAKIQRKISSIEALKTFWSSDKLVYLYDFYYPSKILHNNTSKFAQTISELPTGNLIIEGIVGQGKSIYLRHLATSDIRSNNAKNFPIFLEFRTLTKDNSLEQAIKKYLDEVNIDCFDDKTFDYVMSSGKFVLLLDAFDELDSNITKDTFYQIENYCEKYENLKIIITTRPSSEIQKSNKFEVIKIAPLKQIDYAPFLTKLGLPSITTAEINSSIKSSPSKISELITTPLMLTLVVLAYRSVKKIPENLPDFFEVLFKCVFSSHDSAKPYLQRDVATKLSEKNLQEIFEAFCFVCIKEDIKRSVTTIKFDEIFEKSKKLLGTLNCDANSFRKDIHKVTCLILSDGYENWSFLHKSIMEYYAASFIKKTNDEFAEKFYAYALKNNSNWMQSLIFLHFIDEFRFTKYYLLPEIEIEEAILPKISDNIKIEDIARYYKSSNIEIDIMINDSIKDNNIGMSISHMSERYCSREIIYEPILEFSRNVYRGNTTRNQKIEESIEEEIKSNQSLVISFSRAAILFQDEDLISNFKLYASKILEMKIKAKECIEIHNRRCDFFEID